MCKHEFVWGRGAKRAKAASQSLGHSLTRTPFDDSFSCDEKEIYEMTRSKFKAGQVRRIAAFCLFALSVLILSWQSR
jgi:hypothetical protein